MLTYYITGEHPRIAEVFSAGVDFVQLRAKNLETRELLRVAEDAVRAGRLFVNDRADVAIACGAAGVHLPSNRPAASEYRKITPPGFLISVACHSPEDVERAAGDGADFAILAPIFATPGKGAPIGVRAIERSTGAGIPVIALGGITRENARECRDAGASGVAAIRLFEESRDLPALISELRRH